MINQEILDYIKNNLENGFSHEEIKNALASRGWQETDINQAFYYLESSKVLSKPVTNDTRLISPQQFKPKHSNLKIIKPIIVVILALALLVISALGVIFAQSPGKILVSSLNKLEKVKSFSYQGSITSDLISNYTVNPDFLKGDVNVSNSIKQDPSKIKSTFNFNGAYDHREKTQSKFGFVFTNELPDITFSIGGEIISLEKMIYARLTNIPDFGLLQSFNLKNQWIEYDLSQLEKTYSSLLSDTSEEEEIISSAKMQKLRQLIAQYPVIKITNRFALGWIDHQLMRQYQFTIDTDKTMKFITETNALLYDQDISDDQLTNLADELKVLDQVKGRIWLGVIDNLPHQISLNFNLPDKEKSPVKGKISFTLNLNNYNQDQVITAPLDAKSIEELWKIPQSTFNQDQDKDDDQLSDTLERQYGTDPKIPDTDGDGYLDGVEVKNGYNPNGNGQLDNDIKTEPKINNQPINILDQI